MLTCKEVSRLVSDSLDRKLSVWQRAQVWMHLRMCDLCRRFRKQTLFLGVAARHLLTLAEDVDAPAEGRLDAAAKDRIKQALRPDAH